VVVCGERLFRVSLRDYGLKRQRARDLERKNLDSFYVIQKELEKQVFANPKATQTLEKILVTGSRLKRPKVRVKRPPLTRTFAIQIWDSASE